MSKSRLFAEWAILLLVAIALVILANNRGWGDRLDLNLLDFANSLSAGEGHPDITIVAIDDQSLADVGNWPWDRARHAELIDRLAEFEPAVIAMDILFLEPSNAEADQALARSIENAGNVALPYTFVDPMNGSDTPRLALPVSEFTAAASGVGYVSIDPDRDGVVRRFAPQYVDNGRRFEHFTRVLARLAGFEDRTGFALDDALPIIQYSLPGSYRTETARNVIDGAARKDFFKGKIVMVGATAQGLGDRHAVPTYAGRIMPGVEVQANALAAMIARQTIAAFDAWAVIALHLVAIISLFVVYWLRPPAEALRYSLLLIATLIVCAFASVILFRTWLPVAPALGAILIAYPLWGWRRLATVSRFLEREAAAMRDTGFALEDSAASDKQENAGWMTALGGSSAGFDVVQRQVASLRGLAGEVRERLSFIQDVVDASPDPMMAFDGKGHLALHNARAQEIFLNTDMVSELTLEKLVASLGGKIDAASQEVSLPGEKTYLLASAPLDEALGSEIVALRDITAIKRSEQQRRETLEFLSHDMRSPQVAIIGLTGPSGKGLELDERLLRIDEQARRTLKLAENFVQIARLENEGIRAEDTEMGTLVYEAADRAYAIAKRKNISIDCQVPEEPVFCEVDPSSISRVVDNLLSNALKYSPDGSRIEMALTQPQGSTIKLVLEDQGPGMPAERLAAPFARFGAHDSKAGPSAGLGLAYVKRAVDEHRGTIEVHSAADKGTRIEIELPLTQMAG